MRVDETTRVLNCSSNSLEIWVNDIRQLRNYDNNFINDHNCDLPLITGVLKVLLRVYRKTNGTKLLFKKQKLWVYVS